jgi:hypothetical protein
VSDIEIQRIPAHNGRVRRWVRLHESSLLLLLVAVAVILRVLLAVWCPTPYGYVFDFYHEAIQKSYRLGHLANAEDCWQCYHPPLFTLLGLPLYALGKRLVDGEVGLADPALRFVAVLPVVCGAITAWFAYRILRLYRVRGTELVLGTGLILAFPCLVISSFGLEADILLTALMTAFLYYLLDFLRGRRHAGILSACRLGALAGLACSTKYTGLLAPIILVMTFGIRAAVGPARDALLPRAALALAVCLVAGSWKYVDNVERHHTLLHANGSAQLGFVITERPILWRDYDFSTLRMRDLLRLARGGVRPGHLTDVPFYRSVWTTLHGMAWTDMGMFSDPSRHGFYRMPYPRKIISPKITSSVLILGLVPDALALIGFLATLRRRALAPLAVTAVMTMAAYISWFLSQASWGLKTKYILFLLPAYVLYALLGLRCIRRLSPPVAHVCSLAMALLVVAAHIYLLNFAVR